MKFLDNDLKKIYEKNMHLFPNKVSEVGEKLINQIGEMIILRSSHGISIEKIEGREAVINNIEESSSELKNCKEYIDNGVKNKINRINDKKDRKEIQQIIKNLILSEPEKRFRSTNIRSNLAELNDNQFNNYDLNKTRQIIYSAIADLRKEFRNENFENGYIISKHVIKEDKEDDYKIDGGVYTKDRKKIENYFKSEINEHQKAVDNFSNYLDKLISD